MSIDERREIDIGVTEEPGRAGLLAWLTTTDHKRIGILYICTAFVFLLVGGGIAEAIRTELAAPGIQVMDETTYNSMFTMHGTIMLLLFATPVAFGLNNYLLPLHIGAPDMAFPRLNMLSYWMFLFGSLMVLGGFLASDGAAQFGWTAYAPLADSTRSLGIGGDLWAIGLMISGIGSIMTAVNFITTTITLRAPGMTMFRMPIFTWNMLITSFLVLLAFAPLTGALAMLFMDRRLDTQFFNPAAGGDPILWQHLFWWFGHPEVYVIALPFFGVVTEVFPVFSRRPIFGYKEFVLASASIAALSTTVWAHHMLATGQVAVLFFTASSFLIAIPTGVKFFAWIGTMWGGQLRFATPMLFALGFLVTFLIGGLTGMFLASAPLDYALTDSYFVVAHLHYVLVGTVLFGLFAGVYMWFPKMTGRMLSERLGKLHFWIMLPAVSLTFFPQHQLGLNGMPRRIADYPAGLGWEWLNQLSTIGAYLIGVSILVFCLNVVISLRRPPTAPADPWDAATLEWLTSSPPPEHNFDALPPIRSERPAFDWKWMHVGGVGATGEEEAWRRRQRHDENLLPLHPYTEASPDEPPSSDGERDR